MAHQVYTRIQRPPEDYAARFLKVKYEIIPNLIPRAQLVDRAIRPLVNRDWKIAGPAVTVLQDRANSFMAIASTAVTQPGDIILVAVQGDESSASWGGGLTRSARNAGIAGVAVDGSVLDTSSILTRGVPVFCRSATVLHIDEDLPGSINVPVAFGGVTVMPGDYVLGDLDGMMIIPQADVEAVLIEGEQRTAHIATIAARMEREGITLFDLRGGRGPTEQAGVEWID